MGSNSQNLLLNLLIMKITIFLLIFILILFTGCKNNIERIIKHQDEIITLGRSKEIVNDNERSFYMLTTYSSESNGINMYIFEKGVNKKSTLYTLLRDSIQFTPDNVININKLSSKYHEEICNYFLKKSRILKSYGIKSLTGKTYENSYEITIYLEAGGILFYEPNVDKLEKKDSEIFKEISTGWYLLK